MGEGGGGDASTVKFVNNFDPEKKKDTCLILHCAVTPLTTLLVSEIKMAAQILRSKVSVVLQEIRISFEVNDLN